MAFYKLMIYHQGMALHLYNRVTECQNTRADMSAIPSISWNLNSNMPGNIFNVNVNVSIATKLSTCKICIYDINISQARAILRALGVHQYSLNRLSVNKLLRTQSLIDLVACKFSRLLGFSFLSIYF